MVVLHVWGFAIGFQFDSHLFLLFSKLSKLFPWMIVRFRVWLLAFALRLAFGFRVMVSVMV